VATAKKAAATKKSTKTVKPSYIWGDNISDVGCGEFSSKEEALKDIKDNMDEDSGPVNIYEVRLVGTYRVRTTLNLEEVK
jgi:hypothetical protein